MRTTSSFLALLILLTGSSLSAEPAPAMTQEQVVAEIKELGGTVVRDGSGPTGAVVEVWVLASRSPKVVTDTQIKHFAELSHLKTLVLTGTAAGDAGLEHLKGLKELQFLGLSDTKVTDAGLEHLVGLAQLQYVNLKGSKVTEAGIKKLQEALPKCTIDH